MLQKVIVLLWYSFWWFMRKQTRKNISEETTPKQFPILKFIVKINCTRKNSKCEWLQYFYFAIIVRICLDQLCCVLELWELPLGPNLAQVSVSNPKYILYYWSFVKIWYIVQVNFIDRVGSLVFMFKHTHVFYTLCLSQCRDFVVFKVALILSRIWLTSSH